MTYDQRDALMRIRDEGGSLPIEEFDPDLRADLVRLGWANCTAQRTIELTERGKQEIMGI